MRKAFFTLLFSLCAIASGAQPVKLSGGQLQLKGEPFIILGGDEDHQGRHLRIPAGSVGVQHLKIYRY